MINNNILPYIRKNTSTLLVFSAAAILMLLLASPLALFNLVPVQAQTNLSFQTPTPANGDSGTLTFKATGTTSTSDPSRVDITNGTVQWQWETGQTYTGEIYSGSFNNNTRGGEISFVTKLNNLDSGVSSPCRTADSNLITLNYQNEQFDFNGAVDCGTAGDTTAQPSSSSSSSSSSPVTGTTTTTTQDSDGDGIPDSSDNCPHNSNHRCFKEGEASSTTPSSSTQQEQQPSSSSSSGNGNQTG